MFTRDKDYKNYIQTVRVNLGKDFGLENEEDCYIILREPSEKVVSILNSADENSNGLDSFVKILPDIIKEHDFFESEGVKMTNEALAELLCESMATLKKVMKEYTEAAFFIRLRETEN